MCREVVKKAEVDSKNQMIESADESSEDNDQEAMTEDETTVELGGGNKNTNDAGNREHIANHIL